MTPELSERFEREVRASQLKSTRAYTAITILLSLFFLIPDAQFLSNSYEHIALIRILVAISCLLALFSLQWLSVKQSFALVTIGMLVFNGMVVYVGVVAASYGEYTYQLGTVLLIIYCCTLFQAPLSHSTFIVVGCTVTYFVGILGFSETDPAIVLNIGMVFVLAAIMGIMAVMQREKYLLQHFKDTLRLEKQSQFAHHQARTDALTGLPNRYSLMGYLESYKGLVPENMLMIMIDVDNFKQLNDQYGHAMGDQALQNIANSLKVIVDQEQGYLARYGGEEFIIFLENMSISHGRNICDILVKSISQSKYDELPKITISLGGYYSTGLESSISECIEVADQTLLDVKRSGKNAYKIHDHAR